MNTEKEMIAAQAWLDWSMNPCGKSKLVLAKLDQLVRPLRSEDDLAGVLVKGCQVSLEALKDGDKANQRVAKATLEQAVWWDREFPSVFAYFLGFVEPEEPGGERVWLLEVYARGEPMAVLPEPPKPEFMQ